MKKKKSLLSTLVMRYRFFWPAFATIFLPSTLAFIANQISATASKGNCVKHENIQIDPMVGRNRGHFLCCLTLLNVNKLCVFYMLNQYSSLLQFECRTSCFYGNKHTRNILYLLLGARVKKICNILRKRQDSVKSTFEFKKLGKN